MKYNMKKNLFFILGILVMASLVLVSCKKNNDDEDEDQSKLPTSFKVDIPSSISQPFTGKGTKDVATDTIPGDDLYRHLGTFIYVGEEAAEIVQHIITFIAVYNINHAMDLTYVSNDDGRDKHLVVVENSTYDGQTWEFQLTITDSDSESAADGGKGIQIFWNTDPVKGIAILKPYNLDRDEHLGYPDAMYRVDYSEAGEYGYEKHMIVYIANLPLADPLVNPYSMKTLKMFAGKSGNVVDVYGNSDHPNAKFYNADTGFNWAFAASAKYTENIGVAEVGLPRSTSTATDRENLLVTNSMRNVLSNQIYEVWPTISTESVNAYLFNTQAPGYFNNGGFVAAGTSPGTQYDDIDTRKDNLTPYCPVTVTNLTIEFK
ncbi:MAG: hypothetical protein A2W91_13920 [Bacteroidetes bacterium GWF2_38_335]|nr:MAG: hypothetical protein A2W91_13920 [Bacteroidetes bacterium GWF2_38_335]OFY77813.1 MAG: hypothetical protein A2281_15610 [Bacteroidetes bacterium RIFOXYA12_FULL_38_20]